MPHTLLRRLGRLAPIAALILTTGVWACEDFLVAENPGAIEADDLNKPNYVNLITNGVIGEFQPALGYMTWWNGIFTDELYNRATFAEEPMIDRRDVRQENGTYSFFYYGNIHRTRFLADDGARRLKIILGDSASRDLRLSRVLAYGGMTYVYIAEALCESPIDMSAPLPPDSLFERAIERFDEAIAVATAAKTHAQAQTPVGPGVASADSLINFARVGAARAYLNMNNKPKAIEYATPVPHDFVFWAYYSENSTRENNWIWNRIGNGAGNNGTMLNTPFDTIGRGPDGVNVDSLRDPRVPRRGGTLAATNPIPNAPASFSVNTTIVNDTFPTTRADSLVRRRGVTFTRSNAMRIASGLEARYIIAEAQGPTASTLEFVNYRRKAGYRPPVSLSGDALMEELREQRSRDFYLDNHRLGDLRRYKKYYGVDKFQKGAYPTSTTGETYMDNVSCWPLPISEINDNPNVPKPYTSPGSP